MKKIYIIILTPLLIIKHWNFFIKCGIKAFYNTVRINFKYFKFSQAFVFPIYVSNNYEIRHLGGLIQMPVKYYAGMIRFGLFEIGIYSKKSDRGILDFHEDCKIIFHGKADFGVGCRISINKNAIISIGDNFGITAASTIICYNKIIVGKDCLFSWDVELMDSDMHSIKPSAENARCEILIGNHVWIGSNCTILKNSKIMDNSIIGARTLLNKEFLEGNILIAGNPGKMIKRNINWQ